MITYQVTAENLVDRVEHVVVARTAKEALSKVRRFLGLSRHNGRVKWTVERVESGA